MINIADGVGGKVGAVAGLLDRGDQILRRGAGSDLYGGSLGRVVDGRTDAVDSVELLLDPCSAGGTGHALHVQVNGLQRSIPGHGLSLPKGHRVTSTV